VFEGWIELPRLCRTRGGPGPGLQPSRADHEVADEAWDILRDEVAHSRTVFADRDLDTPVDVHGQEAEARDIVVHLADGRPPGGHRRPRHQDRGTDRPFADAVARSLGSVPPRQRWSSLRSAR